MKFKNIVYAVALSLTSGVVNAAGMGSDDPLLFMFKAHKFEMRDSEEGSLMVWEAEAWLGKDLEKIWIKTSGERVDDELESHEIDLLYSKAISPYWDLQMGLRHEFKPSPSQNSIGIGFNGLAPYLFEVDANLFVNEDSNFNLRLDVEYEYMLTQKWVLIPNLELSLNSKDDDERGVVSGVSSVELGVRVLYEIKRELAPYIGINFEKSFGNSTVEKESETQFVAGLSFWF